MFRLNSCSLLLGLIIASGAQAQEYPWVGEALPPHLEARVNIQEANLQLSKLSPEQRGFIVRAKIWNTQTPIRVCFFGGSQQLRAKIADYALQWTQTAAYIPLDFGNIANPRLCSASDYNQIRVGFAYKGYWSLVGTDSVNLASQLEQSMNLSMFDVAPPPEDTFRRVVLHEFGHALGLHHEHQSPEAPCKDEFEWGFINTYLAGPPNYWSQDTIDHNLRPIVEAGTEAGVFDPKAVMLYSFPVEFYRTGAQARCYTAGNTQLSEEDKTFIADYYTASAAGAVASAEAALESYVSALQALDLPAQQKLSASFSASQIRAATDLAAAQPMMPWGVPGGFGSMAVQPMINLETR